jgi:hypothetical protein
MCYVFNVLRVRCVQCVTSLSELFSILGRLFGRSEAIRTFSESLVDYFAPRSISDRFLKRSRKFAKYAKCLADFESIIEPILKITDHAEIQCPVFDSGTIFETIQLDQYYTLLNSMCFFRFIFCGPILEPIMQVCGWAQNSMSRFRFWDNF